jgi:hypothetical protein
LLNPANAADRKFAVRAGLIAEEWSRMTAAQHRILSEELTGRLLAISPRARSGSPAWPPTPRLADGRSGWSSWAHLTNQVGKRFEELDPRLARAMQRHGIGADTWDHYPIAPLEEHKGAAWLLPHNIENQLAGDRLLQMIQTETDFAVPVADPRTRAMMNSVAPKGTWMGELTRSALLFKTFGISLMMTHGRRMLEQSPVNMARYAGVFFLLSTLGGAAAMELKMISKGQDPRPCQGARIRR